MDILGSLEVPKLTLSMSETSAKRYYGDDTVGNTRSFEAFWNLFDCPKVKVC